MKDKPLIVSLLLGLIVFLVIAGVSLLVKMNALDKDFKMVSTDSLTYQEKIEEFKVAKQLLEKEKSSLEAKVADLNYELTQVKMEYQDSQNEFLKLEKLKEKLEENLKEELMKNQLAEKEFLKAEKKVNESSNEAVGRK